MKFRIVELLLFTSVVAAGFACLRGGADLACTIYTMSVVGLILFATVLAIGLQSERRFFWIGFSVTGLILIYSCDLHIEAAQNRRLQNALLTPMVVELWETMHINAKKPSSGGFGGGGFGGGGGSSASSATSYFAFIQVGHAMITFLSSWFLGHICMFARTLKSS